jgi:PAS domain S-box-containing protein
VPTALSVVPAMIGSGIAIHLLARRRPGRRRLHGGALALAAGIGSMHYLGMEAMRAPLSMGYVPSLFTASIVVAYALAACALHVRFALAGLAVAGGSTRATLVSLAGAIVMGCGVAGMHYTAMAAVRFRPGIEMPGQGMLVSTDWLALAVAAVAFVVVGVTLLMTYVDRQLSLAARSALGAAARHRAILASMPDGLVTFDERGVVDGLNPAARAMLAYDVEPAGTLRVTELLPELDLTALPGEEADDAAADTAPREMTGLRRDGRTVPLEVSVTRMSIDGIELFNAVFRDVTSRKRTEMGLRRLATAVEHASETVVISDADGIVRYVNPAFERSTGFRAHDVLGRPSPALTDMLGNPGLGDEINDALAAGKVWSGQVVSRRKDGSLMEGDGTVSPVWDSEGRFINSVGVFRDVTERAVLERQLQQAQKLEAIGQLAAGIAHEINTPTQYVGDNIRFLQDSFDELLPLLVRVRDLAGTPTGPCGRSLPEEALAAIEGADLGYLIGEIPLAIEQSLEGMSRVSRIVRAMKEFSHPGEGKTLFDINRAIQSTVTVATNEWKYVAELDLDLEAQLPPVPLLAGEFNQVILNMIVNAAHAIAEVRSGDAVTKGLIRVSTRREGDVVEVRVSDTGAGIPDEIKGKIFEPFFTTKDVGRGTGQGLAIAHAVIVKKHAGELSFQSEVGRGSTFIIRLPLADPSRPDAEGRAEPDADGTAEPGARVA